MTRCRETSVSKCRERFRQTNGTEERQTPRRNQEKGVVTGFVSWNLWGATRESHSHRQSERRTIYGQKKHDRLSFRKISPNNCFSALVMASFDGKSEQWQGTICGEDCDARTTADGMRTRSHGKELHKLLSVKLRNGAARSRNSTRSRFIEFSLMERMTR